VLPDIPDPELRAMFQRLNRNVVALNQQELRHATYWGAFITCMEKLAEDDRWTNVGVFTSNDIRRMLDIEYISEIVIGYLHGVQNKKDQLDHWYKAYEKQFESRRDVVSTVNAVLGEIIACLPSILNSRWKKKSDFYTLFLAFAEYKNKIPFSSNARTSLGDALSKFGDKVDEYVKDPDAKGVSKGAKAYGQAVERAASDFKNRKTRLDELLKIFRKVVG
jgi:hypothetical protein